MSAKDDQLREYFPDPETLARLRDNESVEGDIRRLAEDEGVREAVGALHDLAVKQSRPREPEPSERAEYVPPVTVPPVVRPARSTKSRIKLAADVDPRQVMTQPSLDKIQKREQAEAQLARLPRTVGGKTARLPQAAGLTPPDLEASHPSSSPPPPAPPDIEGNDTTIPSVRGPQPSRSRAAIAVSIACAALLLLALIAFGRPKPERPNELPESAAATFAPPLPPQTAEPPPSAPSDNATAALPTASPVPASSPKKIGKPGSARPSKTSAQPEPSPVSPAPPPATTNTPSPATATARPPSGRIHD